MANPVVVPCPADAWTKVATAITSATVKKLNVRPNIYLETYRVTGGAAPADKTGANPIDATGELNVASAVAIDIYIQPVGAAGSVRVDA